MEQPSGVYDVWVKGSQNGAVIGAAWKIVCGDEARTGSTVARLKGPDRMRAGDIAEFVAVTCALAEIPNGSDVRLHTAADNVVVMLGMGNSPRSDAPQGLRAVFECAQRIAGGFPFFQLSKSQLREQDMAEVRDIARRVSGLGHAPKGKSFKCG